MENVCFRSLNNEVTRKMNEDGSESRVLTFVASDGSRDTAHTVLNTDNWDLKRFNSNGIIGYQHKVYGGWDDTQNPDNVIGKGHAYTENGKLMVDIEFEPEDINPLAEKVFKKLLFGSLRGVSVGFLPVGTGHWGTGKEAMGEERETYYYAGQELLEISVVNIPANPNALKRGLEIAEEEMKILRSQAEPKQTKEDNSNEVAEAEKRKILSIAEAALR